MKATIPHVRIVGVRLAQNELTSAPRITETQCFSSGIENFVKGKQVREVAQIWMGSVS